MHDIGVSTVLITSIVFETDDCQEERKAVEKYPTTTESLKPPANSIGMFASKRRQCTPLQSKDKDETEHTDEQYILYTPRLQGQFTGTGDVCAALFLGWTADDHANKSGGSDLDHSLEKLAGKLIFLREMIFISTLHSLKLTHRI